MDNRKNGLSLGILQALMSGAGMDSFLGAPMPPSSPMQGIVPMRSKGKGGKFPQGKRHRITPPYKNPKGNFCKNSAQALHMNRQFVAWYENKFGVPYAGEPLLGIKQ